MSVQSYAPSSQRLAVFVADLRDWLGQARAALTVHADNATSMSDAGLRDLDIRQTDIGRLVDRDTSAIVRLSLTRAHSRLGF